MPKTTDDKGKSKHFRWKPVMSRFMLEMLAREAMKGNKPSSTFKAESLVRVAALINEKFKVDCNPDHIENHLRTIRREWTLISTLKSKSGFGWDDNLKMILVDQEVYDAEILEHPTHEKYLNKKIEMYDEMAIVVGKDMATGSFAKSFADINLDGNTVVDSNPCENEVMDIEAEKTQATSSYAPSSRSDKSGNKRKRADDGEEGYIYLGDRINKMASAIGNLQFDFDHLFEELSTLVSDDDTLEAVYAYLGNNEAEGRAFLGRNARLRKKWIENFIAKHQGGSM